MVNGNLGYSYYNQPGSGQQNFGNQQNVGYYQQNAQQQNTPYVPPILVDYVQGELAASIYPVAYNQKVILLDMDDPDRVYRKSRDGNGKVTPLEKCKIVPEENKQLFEVDLKEYVKEDDILELIADAVHTEVDKRLSEISFKPAASDNKFIRKGDKS